ncbi:type VI secretion system Vgr family protein [Roseibium sp. TrichSKD4]|uniref:type VI secretion system Vgr family protein n=1 Tax=Roseibium sp. TrichSKD4 TaxID=744980 RepID=UPI0001E56D1F|nr:type VI secretion system tip protein VgrG [Roseibium sp. TrichSKD4]EFO30245.1 type VI secretion system Vgr family protein [Roseibium sp. TrichSKD4]
MNVLARIPALFQDQDIAFSFTVPAAGDTALLVYDFTVSEALFGLTEVDVQLASDDPNVDLHALLDTPATLTIHHKYLGLRHYAGVIAQISRGEEGFHRTLYSITLLPMLHRLAHGSDCRIFQQKSVPDIIKELLKEHGIEDVKWSLTGSHEAREYCVQYRESHLDFIDRCAAEEGIWYYFTYGENGQHTLHFIDNPEIVAELEGQSSLEYNAMPSGAVKGVFCNRFSLKEQLRSTSYTQRDYTFKNPPYSQQHKVDRQEDNGSAKDYALYDYPGRYKQDAAGKPLTKYRQEAVRVDATTGQGRTNAIHLSPGFKMALTDHPNDACNTAWHLLTVSHHGSQPQALGEEAGGGPATYSASFTAMPARLPYRPSRPAKPLVDGPQIAHVTGPDGEEIYCDEYGRVKVWFPWDRHGEKNDKSSCWIRVASNWAGPKWGHISIPRIGQEVIVDFLEGDPDQPIITGRTYHAQNMPPYKLPSLKTVMAIKSDTHKGGGSNELRFEDESGREQLYLHAQMDEDHIVEHDRRDHVRHDEHRITSHNRHLIVGHQNHQRVVDNEYRQISKDTHWIFGGTLFQKIYGTLNLTVMGAFVRSFRANRSTIVKGTDTLKVEGASTTSVLGKTTLKAPTIVLEGTEDLTIKGPGGFVKIDAGGVTVVGKQVKINQGGSPGTASDAMPVPPQEPSEPQEADPATDRGYS